MVLGILLIVKAQVMFAEIQELTLIINSADKKLCLIQLFDEY